MDNSLVPFDEHLDQAYRATVYEVDVLQNPLLIGEPHFGLDHLLSVYGIRTAAFLTAWNPASRPTSPQVNTLAQKKLQQRLDREGRLYFPGRGRDPDGTWPPEESYLILGLSLPESAELAYAFRQNAFLFCESGKATALKWTLQMMDDWKT